MVAITTPSTVWLIKTLSVDLSPDIRFTPAANCRWSPREHTIYYADAERMQAKWDLLHEIAHCRLGHVDFTRDIELLAKEREAWAQARDTLAPQVQLAISEAYIDASLDTYRHWLHARSLCPTCSQTGLQTKTDTYQCINCRCQWRVNDARMCQLKRYQF